MTDTPGEDAESRGKEEGLFPESDKMLVPSLYVDAFSTTYWKDHIRLVFGERTRGRPPYWRAAFVIETSDAQRLVRLLQRVIKELEPPKESSE